MYLPLRNLGKGLRKSLQNKGKTGKWKKKRKGKRFAVQCRTFKVHTVQAYTSSMGHFIDPFSYKEVMLVIKQVRFLNSLIPSGPFEAQSLLLSVCVCVCVCLVL